MLLDNQVADAFSTLANEIAHSWFWSENTLPTGIKNHKYVMWGAYS